MYNHLEDTENVFVPAAHTFCSCVNATCRGGEEGGVHTTACPCITHRTSFPPYRGLCGYCMYMMERCRWTRMQIALVLLQVSVFFDKDDSWLTSLCPSACLEKTHVFSPFQGRNNLPPKWKIGRLKFRLFIRCIAEVSAPVCFALTLLPTLLQGNSDLSLFFISYLPLVVLWILH